jgi:uncharacterized membrane protein YfcA
MEIFLISILGLLMGVISAISGGSGVFGVPTMLALGIPPINVLTLNRMSDVGVVFGALRGYHKAKIIDWKLALIIAIPLAIGSFIGANTIISLPDKIIKYIILVGVFIGIFFLLKKTRSDKNNAKAMNKWLGLGLMLVVGIWSGLLAMAGATFAVLVLVYFFNKDYLQARSTDIVAAIPETLIAAIVLFMGSTVSIFLIMTMILSSFIGSWIGSHIAVKNGNNFIRKTMIGIAILMLIKVIFDLF